MHPAKKVRDRLGQVVKGHWNYRGFRIINKFYDGWYVYPILSDGTVSEKEAACTPLLCLAKKAVDKLVG